jgi:tetratricopeptide (TPR) repeat protein
MKVFICVAICAIGALSGVRAADAPSELEQQASAAVKDGQFMLALPMLEKLVRDGNASERVLSDAAWTLYSLGSVEEAERACLQGLKQYPKSPTLSFISALILTKQGQFEQALERIVVASSKSPNYEPYKVMKGMLLLHLHRVEEAEATSHEIGDKSKEALFLKAAVLASKGSIEESLRILRERVNGDAEAFGAKYEFARIASTQTECSPEDAKLALRLMIDVLAWAQKQKIEFLPPCLLYLVTACALANAEQYEMAVVIGSTALRMYEERCGTPEDVFKQALDSFKKERRFVKTQWP